MNTDKKPSEQLPAFSPDYSDILGKTIHIQMDRPLGSRHPRHPEMVYPVNYGYVDGIIARDGADQDVYLLGIDVPVAEYTATVIGFTTSRTNGLPLLPGCSLPDRKS